MSTSFIYHALDLSGYEYVGQKFHAGCVIFQVRPKWRIIRCPVCKFREPIRRFHVVKLMNEVLTETRHGLYREMKDAMQKDILKGSRWILLKNPANLSDKHNEEARLKEALELNAPLATACFT